MTTRPDKKQAERQIIRTCWVTILIVVAAWLLLWPFPTLRKGVVCTVFGIGFFRLAYLGLKTGVMPYRWWLVSRDDEVLFFWILIISEIVTALVIIWFGWWA